MSAEVEPRAAGDAPPATDDTGMLRLRIDAGRVSDVEVAAVSVAVTALLGGHGAPQPPVAAPAWRRAGMLEASTPRRIRTPGELRAGEAR